MLKLVPLEHTPFNNQQIIELLSHSSNGKETLFLHHTLSGLPNNILSHECKKGAVYRPIKFGSIFRCEFVKTNINEHDLSQDQEHHKIIKEYWFTGIRQSVSDTNSTLMLAIDIFGTLIDFEPSDMFNIEYKIKGDDVFDEVSIYYNPQVLNSLLAVQSRGHIVKVITNASFPFSLINQFFQSVNLSITRWDYRDKKDFFESGRYQEFKWCPNFGSALFFIADGDVKNEYRQLLVESGEFPDLTT